MNAADPRHGTRNGYSNLRCRCRPCKDAWAKGHRPVYKRWRAANLAAGLTVRGTKRSRPYDARALAAIAQHGLTPDPRWLPSDTCPQGHAWTDKNTYQHPKGHRVCRRCNADRRLRSYYRQKLAAA